MEKNNSNQPNIQQLNVNNKIKGNYDEYKRSIY